MSIKNIDDLRTHAIDTINRLRSQKIDVTEAGVTAKLYENIISTIKLQLERQKMTGDTANIKFLNEEKLINGKQLKQIAKDN